MRINGARMSRRPMVLDLFCGAGGAAEGYHRAGYEVVGVDLSPQPAFRSAFVQTDAIEFLKMMIDMGTIDVYALIHASPPCQANSALTKGTNESRGWGGKHEDFIPKLKEQLARTSVPSVIEQPVGSAPIRHDLVLCGEMYGLGVIRHRFFELGNWTTDQPGHQPHRGRVRGWRHGRYFDGPYVAAYGAGGGKASVQEMRDAMGIDWMTERGELTEAIPPAYTQFIGERFRSWQAANSTARLETASTPS